MLMIYWLPLVMVGKSKRQGFETVKCDGFSYTFKSDFSFLAELTESTTVDPFEIYARINAGQGDPILILNVMVASIHSKENTPIEPSDKLEVCRGMITSKGLQECHILAKTLLAWGMIGDEKKSEMRQWNVTQQILENLDVFQLMNSKKVQLLWGSILVNFGICVWLIFKTSVPPIF